MATTCPACGIPFAETFDLASHMAQKRDSEHPWKTYDSALEVAESEGETDTETDEPEPDQGGTPPEGGGGSRDRPENPLLESPPEKENPDNPCPSCGGPTTLLGEGRYFEGEVNGDPVAGATTEGDRGCGQCDVIKSENGTIVTNVQ